MSAGLAGLVAITLLMQTIGYAALIVAQSRLRRDIARLSSTTARACPACESVVDGSNGVAGDSK